MGLLRELLEGLKTDDQFDATDVLSKMKTAEKTNKDREASVGFGLEEINKETGETKIIKVFVARDQADEFENALAAALDEFEGEKEVAEILFVLRNRFNIVNVEWPSIPEDEEIDQELAGGPGEGSDVVNAIDGGEDMTANDQVKEVPQDEEGAKSALQAVIDMMKADAEARQAEAEAKKAEAEAKSAEYAAQAAMAKVKSEEEIMDMEAYYKEKEEKKKEAENLAKLAKYRHDKVQDVEKELGGGVDVEPALAVTPSEDEEVAIPTELKPDANDDHYLDDNEYLAYIEKFLRRKAQR